MIELAAVVGLVLLLGQLVLLIHIRNTLSIIAHNQQQAHDDVAATAATLAGADLKRQTHDPESGENSVNTKVRKT